MSREEVSALGSARREEVRRQIENSERLKANPLLYLVSPQVKVILFCFFYLIYYYFMEFAARGYIGYYLNFILLFTFTIEMSTIHFLFREIKNDL